MQTFPSSVRIRGPTQHISCLPTTHPTDPHRPTTTLPVKHIIPACEQIAFVHVLNKNVKERESISQYEKAVAEVSLVSPGMRCWLGSWIERRRGYEGWPVCLWA